MSIVLAVELTKTLEGEATALPSPATEVGLMVGELV
jgi:hypothetical protein